MLFHRPKNNKIKSLRAKIVHWIGTHFGVTIWESANNSQHTQFGLVMTDSMITIFSIL